MADKIKAVLESFAWDLRAFEKKGIFSQEELRDIMKEREDFEYRMNKNTSKDVDFLSAIQYEMELVGLQSLSPGRAPKGESH